MTYAYIPRRGDRRVADRRATTAGRRDYDRPGSVWVDDALGNEGRFDRRSDGDLDRRQHDRRA